MYSLTGSPASTAAAMAAPRAWPSSSVECGLMLTKTFSTATSVGTVLGDHVRQVAHDDAEPHGQARAGGANAAAADVDERVAARFEYAETGDAQSGVDAEDASHRALRFGEHRGRVDVLHVVERLEGVEQLLHPLRVFAAHLDFDQRLHRHFGELGLEAALRERVLDAR